MSVPLYHAVYEDIRNDILRKKYVKDDSLATLKILCEMHGVSRNTMRSALHLLEVNGFIVCEKGVCAKVVYDHRLLDDHKTYCIFLVSKKDAVHEVYQTLGFLMPEVAQQALIKSSRDRKQELKERFQKLIENEEITSNELMDSLLDIYIYGLSILDNVVLIDLVRSMMSFAFLPLLEEQLHLKVAKNQMRMVRNVFLKQFVHAVVENPFVLKKMLPIFCSGIDKSVQTYIAEYYKDVQVEHKVSYEWRNTNVHDYLYQKVTTDILYHIQCNLYQKDTQLPSIQYLSQSYQVSKRTIRKALKQLHDIQVIEINNGIRSVVTYDKAKEYSHILTQDSIFDGMQQFQKSLEVCKWIMKSFTKKQVCSISAQQYKDMIQKYDEKEVVGEVFLALCKEYNAVLFTISIELKKQFIFIHFVHLLIGDQNFRESMQEQFILFKKAFLAYHVVQGQQHIVNMIDMLFARIDTLLKDVSS